MKVYFRADSGAHIGAGHIVRCKTLAEKLKTHGCEIHFITRAHHQCIRDFENFEVKFLDSTIVNKENFGLDYTKWLGATLDDEIKDVNNYIKENGEPDWLVVDHYALDYKFEESINAKNIFVIDDILNRKHSAKALLNQNLGISIEDYDNLLNLSCKRFIGPEYSLLNDKFSSIRNLSDEKEYVAVYFGSTDVTNETLKVAKAFKDTKQKMKIILSQKHETYEEVFKISGENENIEVLDYVNDMAIFMNKSKVFLGACGTTSWERCALGIPSVCIVSAENQRYIANGLSSKRAIYLLGDGLNTNVESWVNAKNIFLDNEWIHKVSQIASTVTDGMGCDRIAKYMMEIE